VVVGFTIVVDSTPEPVELPDRETVEGTGASVSGRPPAASAAEGSKPLPAWTRKVRYEEFHSTELNAYGIIQEGPMRNSGIHRDDLGILSNVYFGAKLAPESPWLGGDILTGGARHIQAG